MVRISLDTSGCVPAMVHCAESAFKENKVGPLMFGEKV